MTRLDREALKLLDAQQAEIDALYQVVLDPEREKAVARYRRLKSLRDGSTFISEKANAQAAMDRLKAKHGIDDREA